MNFLTKNILLGSLLLVAGGCDTMPATVAGGTDETHSTVSITGTVFTDRSTPFAGLVVRLRHLGLSDTTDARGAYRLVKTDTVLAAVHGSVDTLDIWREGRVIHSEAVPAWIDTMPDVFLTQRNISGKLAGDASRVKRVVALFGTDRGDTLELEWNPLLGAYSGFLYSPWDGNLTHYQLRVEVEDSLHRLIGRSADIPFTSRAGDLEIPAFSAGNARPTLKLSGPDTVFSRELMVLRASVSDSFGQNVSIKWREITDGRIFAPGSGKFSYPLQRSTDSVVHWYAPSGHDSTIVFHCTVTDEDGLTATDSLVVRRKLSPPQATIGLYTFGDSVRVHMTASDVNQGKIVQYRLFIGYQSWGLVKATYSLCIDSIRANTYTTKTDSGWSSTTYSSNAKSIPTDCGQVTDPTWTMWHFIKRDTGILVSGKDTMIAIPPPDSLGQRPQIALRVVDEDGEVDIETSPTLHKLPPPDQVTWTVEPLVDTTWVKGYLATVRWHSVADSQSVIQTAVQNPIGFKISFQPLDGQASSSTQSWFQDLQIGPKTSLEFVIPTPLLHGCISVQQEFPNGYSVPAKVCADNS